MQNRFWLQLVTTSIVLGGILIIVAVALIPPVFSFWSKTISSDQPTLVEISSEQLVEEMRRKQLIASLDSLKSEIGTQGFDQAILTNVKECCLRRQVTLTSYDRVQADRQSSSSTVSYRLLIEGEFRSVTLLIADLESLPFDLSIPTLALERQVTGSDKLRGILVIQTGAQ